MNRNAVSLLETLATSPLWRITHFTDHEYHRYQRVRQQLARAVTTWPEEAAQTAQALRNRAASYVQCGHGVEPTQAEIKQAVSDMAAAKTIETWLAITARSSKALRIDTLQSLHEALARA